jgi:hypothetical protein
MLVVHDAPAIESLNTLSSLATKLSETRNLMVIQEVQSQAEAFSRWVRMRAGGEKLARDAKVISLQAERRIGQISAKLPKLDGRHVATVKSKNERLTEAGIPPRRARDAEKLAKIPKAEFTRFCESAKPSVGAALKEFGLRSDYSYKAHGEWRQIALDAIDVLEGKVENTRSAVAHLRHRCTEAIRKEGQLA